MKNANYAMYFPNYDLQACKRRMCMENSEDICSGDEERKKVVTMSSNLEEICEFLVQLLTSYSHLDINSSGHNAKNSRLMEETELFLRLLAGNGEN